MSSRDANPSTTLDTVDVPWFKSSFVGVRRGLGLIAVVVLLASTLFCRRTPDPSEDRADVEQVFNKYLRSLNAGDVALASQVWLQSPDVLVVTPFGRFKGWDSVRDDIYVNFAQKQLRQRNLHTSNVSIVVAGDAAWLVYDFAFTATWADGRPLTSNGWESHGYLKTVNGWRIAHLHYSVPAAPQ